tara:strand:+ start:9664 stop:10512 length:849 start_codon:yes stop_codon:yes gene_type:complete
MWDELIKLRKKNLSSRIRGDTDKCLKHYYEKVLPQGLRKNAKARAPMMEFIGLSSNHLGRILKGNIKTKGENLIRLRIFLFFKGYSVEELNNMPTETFEIAVLFALNVESLEDIAISIGITRDGVLRRLRGATYSFAKYENERMIQIIRGVKLQNPVKIEEGIKKISDRDFDRITRTPPSRKEIYSLPGTISTPSLSDANNKYLKFPPETLVAMLAGMIEAIIPMTQALISDKFTEEQRNLLREKTKGGIKPGYGVFDASNLLNGLCSEDARKTFLKSLNNR